MSVLVTTSVLPPAASGAPQRRRRQFWRSPANQPRWARPALLGIAALAALLYAWNIASSGYAYYYSVAAKSMTVSWKAFLFTTLDPSATITLDKIGGFLWPQALSARIFGFSDWALTLPQCVEGVISVLAMYRMVRRWKGAAAGLVAAALLTLTPVAASMFGHAMLDGSVTMCLVLAADQYQRAVGRGRLRSLLLSGVWVGLGFQAKMMEAWIIVPALAVGYLVVAPLTLRKRLGHLLAAGAVLLAVSFSWLALMTFTPEDSRPYADGSTNNNAWVMVFGYNGFNRFHAGLIPDAGGGMGGGGGQRPSSVSRGTGSVPGNSAPSAAPNGGQQQSVPQAMPSGAPTGQASGNSSGAGQYGQGNQGAPGGGGPGGGRGGTENSWLKLFNSRYASQVGWVYPLALLALAFGLVRYRKAPRTDQARGGYVMWGSWLLSAAGVLSALDNLPHTAYVVTLAPPLAALAAAGTVTMWRSFRAGERPWAWALPIAIAVQAAWAVRVAADYTDFAPWLIPGVIIAALAGLAMLAYSRWGAARTPEAPNSAPFSSGETVPRMRRIGLLGLLAGCVAMFAAPTAWSLSVLDTQYAGSAFDAAAGPSSGGGRVQAFGGGQQGLAEQPGQSGQPGGGMHSGAGPGGDVSTTLTTTQEKLLAYVEKNNGGAKYTFSTDGWNAASPYIYAKGVPVLPLGGFSGTASSFTLAEYKQLVASGDLRFALISSGGGTAGFGPGGADGTSETSKISTWVESACTKISAKAYGGTDDSSSTDSQAAPGTRTSSGGTGSATLYRCASANPAS